MLAQAQANMLAQHQQQQQQQAAAAAAANQQAAAAARAEAAAQSTLSSAYGNSAGADGTATATGSGRTGIENYWFVPMNCINNYV
jgi:outer membrane PBP1 activator LpoA protein